MAETKTDERTQVDFTAVPARPCPDILKSLTVSVLRSSGLELIINGVYGVCAGNGIIEIKFFS